MKNDKAMTINDMINYLNGFAKKGFGDSPILLGSNGIPLLDDALGVSYINDTKKPAIYIRNTWYDEHMISAARNLRDSIDSSVNDYITNVYNIGNDIGKNQEKGFSLENTRKNIMIKTNSNITDNDKILIDDADIVVSRGFEEMPYYNIKYKKTGKDDYTIGFGSYELRDVEYWKDTMFKYVDSKKSHGMEDSTISEKKIDAIIKECKGLLNVSYYKYGPAKKNFGEGRVDAIGCIDNCIIKFRKTHNLEYLEDIINYAILRILYPLPGEALTHTDSDESAGVDGIPYNQEVK